MKRIIDKDYEIAAKTIEEASKKFAKRLDRIGLDYASDEIIESVENGYYYCSNATRINLIQHGEPVAPKTNDWTYYWGIENVDDTHYYAWYIERA